MVLITPRFESYTSPCFSAILYKSVILWALAKNGVMRYDLSVFGGVAPPSFQVRQLYFRGNKY